MEVLKEVVLKNLTVSLIGENILKVIVHEHSTIDVDDVNELQKVKRLLVGNNKHSVLFITPKLGSMTKEARELSASREVNINAIGKAVVLNGLAMRILVNFFINFNKPPVIYRTFENEKDALEWLRSLK